MIKITKKPVHVEAQAATATEGAALAGLKSQTQFRWRNPEINPYIFRSEIRRRHFALS